MEPIEGTSKTFNSGGDFGMDKLSKANELNETMSITGSIVTGKQIGRAHV